MTHKFPDFVPHSLQMDGWWLTADETGAANPPPRSPEADSGGIAARRRLLIALVIIALADWLTWGYRPGVGVVLLAFVLVMGGVFARPTARPWRALVIMGIATLPMLETAGPLSALFLVCGLIGAVLSLESVGLRRFPKALGHFLAGTPRWVLTDLGHGAARGWARVPLARILAAWGLPLALTAIFAVLFLAANPLLDQGASRLLSSMLDLALDPQRFLFWVLILVLTLPLLAARFPALGEPTTIRIQAPGWLPTSAVGNALVLFNALFAVQTVMDTAYLWGGVALPEGMTYATYAHRGAYPLLCTALLSGALMLIVPIFGPLSRTTRWLMVLWIGQNMLLVLSAVLRLELYVSFYSLTYLRLAALIWMGLVAVGFVLILLRLVLDKPNGWAIGRMAVVAMLTLYATSFVNFPGVIAQYNVTHSLEVSGQGQKLDVGYLCRLGPHAEPAVRAYPQLHVWCFSDYAGADRRWRMDRQVREPNWREWGFRNWRLDRYLAAQTASEDPRT